MGSDTRQVFLDSDDATAALAAALAPVLRAGDTLLLDGPVGAGKTAFARALIQARMAATGPVEDVPSPSFALVQVYDLPDLTIWHVDLYRLDGVADTVELGLDEAFETALCLVEWPERLGGALPPGAARLTFAYGPDEGTRHLAVTLPPGDLHDRLAPVLDLAAR
jgi:tRNA threonylcarbamoyladenosine biosynthesis protein TsaE